MDPFTGFTPLSNSRFSKLRRNPVRFRPLKTVQPQGGAGCAGYPPKVGPGVLGGTPQRVRDGAGTRPQEGSPRMGCFQRPGRESSAWRKQVTRWSLTIPTACMKA
jgi:hypothetical protein